MINCFILKVRKGRWGAARGSELEEPSLPGINPMTRKVEGEGKVKFDQVLLKLLLSSKNVFDV